MLAKEKEGYISYEIKIGSKKFVSVGPFLNIETYTEINKVPTATIILKDGDPSTQDFELSSEKYMNPGEKVEISLGYKGKNKPLFKGIILRHSIKATRSSGTYLKIECKHSIYNMTLGRKVRYFEKKDDKKILTSLFSKNKIKPVSFKGAFISHESFLQYDITDWDFLILRCDINSKIISFDLDKVTVEDPKLSGGAVAKFQFGVDLIEYEAEVNAGNQLQGVESFSWDSDTQKIISEKGAPSGFKQLENSGVKSADLKSIFSPDFYDLYHGGEIDKSELGGWGKAQFTKSSLNKIIGRLKIKGDNSLKLGQVVEVEGVGSKFSGKVLITGISQNYGESGWYTNVKFGFENKVVYNSSSTADDSSQVLNSSIKGLQIGKVLKIDGDKQHRVQVSIPIAGSKVKLWARMGTEDAGSKRGFVFWPEKDDEVIIGFLNEDPRCPVILGSLYSKKNEPVFKADPKNPKKGIITKNDIRIVFDDKDKSIVLETPGGNSVTIDDKKKSIILEDQSKNTLKLDSKGITLTSKGDITLDATKKVIVKAKMDLEMEGLNIKQKAKAKFDAAGSAGVDIKSAAMTNIKGTMVNIN